jgi:hypothetical protein
MLGLNLENESFSFSGGIAGCSGLSVTLIAVSIIVLSFFTD